MNHQSKRPWDYHIECEIDPAGQVVVRRADPVLAERLGRSAEELMATSDWMRSIPSDDMERSLDAIATLARGQVWEDRVRVLGTDGEILVLHMRSTPSPLPAGGMTLQIEARDVTVEAQLEQLLAEREARLHLLEQQVNLAWWTTDEALRYTWSSDPNTSGRGWHEGARVGATLYDTIGSDDPNAPPIAAHHRALSGEPAGYEVEWEGQRWRCLLEPLSDELGRINGVLGVAINRALFNDSAAATRAAQSDQAFRLGSPTQDDPVSDMDHGSEAISLDGLVIDPETFVVLKQGRRISLTVTEFKLLMEFARRPGRVLSRAVLAERVWGQEFFGHSASVTMAVSRLRDKIEDDPSNPTLIETVRGVGYRLADGRETSD